MAEILLADGWKEYPDQFKKYARCFFKRFDTPTQCRCNEKKGMQIQISVSEWEGRGNCEMDLCGELEDGTWIKFLNYGMPHPQDVRHIISLVPRLLTAWETINA
jgi:hypothetical protein